MKILEKIILVGIFVLAIVIGAGAAILVTKAIDQSKAEACFDYKNEEICEEIRNGEN